MRNKIIALFLLPLVLVSLCFLTVFAEDSQNINSLDKDTLEEFIDAEMTKQMDELNVPAVTISIVQNDEVLLSKGYGYQNFENKVLTSGYSSMFGIGSVSKL